MGGGAGLGIASSGLGGGLGAAINGGNFFEGFGQGVTVGAFNHALHAIQREMVIRSTKQAVKHYFNGKGASVLLHKDIRKALLSSKKFKQKLGRIKNGETSSLSGNFSIDLTNDFFHVGRTNVDYNVNVVSGEKIQIRFDLFVRDGFWDPDFIDEKLGVQKADGLGPNLERFGGTPYKYIPQYKIYNFTNPGYE